MRPIKFRAWDIDHKEFVYFDFSDLESMELFWGRHQLAENGAFEYQQYTCLKDKNGVEIYEGDILGYLWLTKLDRYYDQVPVLFEQGQFCVYIDGLALHKRLTLDGFLDRMGVIGNIHENPDLLETKKGDRE